jgi:hypothetical protein
MIDAMPTVPWPVFGWYMLGAALRGVWMWLTWLQRPLAEAEPSLRQIAARSGKAIIGSIVIAFVWTGGHMLPLLSWLNIEVPFEVAVTPLSSLAAGFILEMFLVERVIGRVEKK